MPGTERRGKLLSVLGQAVKKGKDMLRLWLLNGQQTAYQYPSIKSWQENENKCSSFCLIIIVTEFVFIRDTPMLRIPHYPG